MSEQLDIDPAEGPSMFAPLGYARQERDYLIPLHKALADLIGILYPDRIEDSDDADDFAELLIESLTEAGWRFVTAKDWQAMTSAWVRDAVR